MSQLIREEMLIGITAFERSSSVSAMILAIGADLVLRVIRVARTQLTRSLQGIEP